MINGSQPYQGTAHVISSLVLACALVGCHAAKPSSVAQPPTVLVTNVLQKDVPIFREWVAQLNGSVNARISPKVMGYVVKRNYQEGYFVTKGQTLFEIDPRPLRAALDQARAAVAIARANLGNSQLSVARDTPLAKEKAISQAQLDNDSQTLAANKASLDAALAQQQNAQLNLEWTDVRSPIDGIAGIATAQVGDLVGTSNLLTSVSQVNPIRAYFAISENDYLSIAPRLSLIVRGEATSDVIGASDLQFIQANDISFPAEGHFVLVGREVSSGTGTIQFAAEFENKGDILRPGGFGKIRIRVGVQHEALLIPQQAVSEVQGQYQVVVITPENQAEFRSIEVGERSGTDWIVTKGLKANERIVVEGFQKLANGVPVEARPYVVTAAKAG